MKRIVVALAVMVCAFGLMAGEKGKGKKCPDCDPKVATKDCTKCECCKKATEAGKACPKCHPEKKKKEK